MEPDSTKTAVDTGAFGVEYAYQSVFRNPYRCGMCRKTRRHGRQDADECFHGNNGGSVLFIALLLSFFLGFQLEWLPAYTDQNMVSEFAWNLKSVEMVAYNAVLPVLSTVVGGIVSYAQSTRNSVIAVANENFIVTAKAKVYRRMVLFTNTF